MGSWRQRISVLESTSEPVDSLLAASLIFLSSAGNRERKMREGTASREMSHG